VLIWLDGWHSTLNLASGLGMAQCVFGFFVGNLTYEVYLRLRDNSLVQGTGPELVATALMILLFWIKPHYTTGNIIGFAIVILLFSFEGGIVSKMLRARPLLFLGQLSYSIYLVHFTIFSVIFAAVRVVQGKLGTPLIQFDGIHELMDFGPKGTMDLLALGYIVAVIICACFTYYLVEVPGRVFFNKLSKRIGTGREAYGQSANAG
jgi:peptidoglycan/LPS O-acetylase OafA/YrhL